MSLTYNRDWLQIKIMGWCFNCLCCCRGLQGTGTTIGVFRLAFSLCMIVLAIKWIILGVDIMNNSHTTNQSKSEEIGEYFGKWFQQMLTNCISVRVSVLGVLVITYLIDFIVSIVLVIGICLRRHQFLFVWLIASFITTLIATLISLFVTISVIDSIILVNTGKNYRLAKWALI